MAPLLDPHMVDREDLLEVADAWRPDLVVEAGDALAGPCQPDDRRSVVQEHAAVDPAGLAPTVPGPACRPLGPHTEEHLRLRHRHSELLADHPQHVDVTLGRPRLSRVRPLAPTPHAHTVSHTTRPDRDRRLRRPTCPSPLLPFDL